MDVVRKLEIEFTDLPAFTVPLVVVDSDQKEKFQFLLSAFFFLAVLAVSVTVLTVLILTLIHL